MPVRFLRNDRAGVVDFAARFAADLVELSLTGGVVPVASLLVASLMRLPRRGKQGRVAVGDLTVTAGRSAIVANSDRAIGRREGLAAFVFGLASGVGDSVGVDGAEGGGGRLSADERGCLASVASEGLSATGMLL